MAMNTCKKVLFLSCLTIALMNAELPEPYRSITLLPADIHGWFGKENEILLKEFIEKTDPQVIVEIGTWLGKSAIFMAHHVSKTAKIYAIDHWLGEVDYHMLGTEITSRLSQAYEQFLSNVIHENVADIIVPMRMSSLQAAVQFNEKIDLIYIDGSHLEEDVYNDIMAWWPKLSENGIMCGDDFLNTAPNRDGVKRAVYRAAAELNLTVKNYNSFWFFVR